MSSTQIDLVIDIFPDHKKEDVNERAISNLIAELTGGGELSIYFKEEFQETHDIYLVCQLDQLSCDKLIDLVQKDTLTFYGKLACQSIANINIRACDAYPEGYNFKEQHPMPPGPYKIALQISPEDVQLLEQQLKENPELLEKLEKAGVLGLEIPGKFATGVLSKKN